MIKEVEVAVVLGRRNLVAVKFFFVIVVVVVVDLSTSSSFASC